MGRGRITGWGKGGRELGKRGATVEEKAEREGKKVIHCDTEGKEAEMKEIRKRDWSKQRRGRLKNCRR